MFLIIAIYAFCNIYACLIFMNLQKVCNLQLLNLTNISHSTVYNTFFCIRHRNDLHSTYTFIWLYLCIYIHTLFFCFCLIFLPILE